MRLPQLKTCDGASAGLVFLSDAIALKAVHKAGRRGGDSIAREGCKHVCGGCACCPETGVRVSVPSRANPSREAFKIDLRAFADCLRRRGLFCTNDTHGHWT